MKNFSRILLFYSLAGKWEQKAVTVAENYTEGNQNNQLNGPFGLYVAENQTVFIADFYNHRIVKWKADATNGQVVAGKNGHLSEPTDVILDKETDSLIICDSKNRRVQSCRRGTTIWETLIPNIDCYGLTMDDQRFLYVSDRLKDEVRRYRIGEKNGTVVAGGNGRGDSPNQLDSPHHVFGDRDYSVYVSDHNNHRVMKWMKDVKEGIIVAGGQGPGCSRDQLAYPEGVFVDVLGTIYVADYDNDRVMRWYRGVTQGTVIAGGNGSGREANQLNAPKGLSFDRHGNMYVADQHNHRVQRFLVKRSIISV